MTRINHEKLNKQKKAGPRGSGFDVKEAAKRKPKKLTKNIRSKGRYCPRCGKWLAPGMWIKFVFDSGTVRCLKKCTPKR